MGKRVNKCQRFDFATFEAQHSTLITREAQCNSRMYLINATLPILLNLPRLRYANSRLPNFTGEKHCKSPNSIRDCNRQWRTRKKPQYLAPAMDHTKLEMLKVYLVPRVCFNLGKSKIIVVWIHTTDFLTCWSSKHLKEKTI